MHNEPSVSASRDRRFGGPQKPVTIYRNRRSRLTEISGHDRPKYAGRLVASATSGAPSVELTSASTQLRDALHVNVSIREKVGGGYLLRRKAAFTTYLDDGRFPIDNNPVENAIRPVAIGRKNWLFAGSLLAGQRAANIMSLIQTAKANGHDPHAYLRDVLTRLPTQLNRRIGELLPHTWCP